MDTKYDEVLLGWGHGFLDFSEKILSDIKELRINYFPNLGISISNIHIVDHDKEDPDRNFPLLENNEFVIYIFGDEKIRKI